MEKTKNSSLSKFNSLFAVIVIVSAIIIAHLVFYLVLGHPSHFTDAKKHEPKVGDYLGIMYKGGFLVPFLMSFFIIVFAVSIERLITLFFLAKGKNSLADFSYLIKSKLSNNDIEGAINASVEQKGSVGNVAYEVLKRYKVVATDTSLSKEKRLDTIQKEIDEATMLELPVLEKNLSIIATLASVSTLVALLGTVIGMIKAFAALATTGTPDPTALATGISEALVNTALGIGTSALAIISYNFFSSKVDNLTHYIEEIGFAIRQTFLANVK
ncbi:MAG: MotA/TolQ/ExbB proton channel family protein [Cytophagaceae bacterium]|nr:MotA/TolQ/ExbB proton channel family protein [Cytophagaceae bacterium]MDW8457264.1 MotA/TolQ/ExbB proton channel family protein [Cytophagaceae bacterium]